MHPFPHDLEDLSNEDLLSFAWEPDFLERATPLERLFLRRLDDACAALQAQRKAVQRLLDQQWERS